MDECIKLLEKEVADLERNLERAKNRRGVVLDEIKNIEWKLATKQRLIEFLRKRFNLDE